MTDCAIPAVIYGAKSTGDPKGSIPTQLEDCRAMAEDEGWDVIDTLQDEGFSAYSGNRGPGLAAAIEAAGEAASRSGSCMLVAQHSDRFARGDGKKARHLGGLYFEMLERGVELRSVQDDGDLRDAIRAVLMGERNSADSKRKSEAVTSGKDRQMDRGERLGGPVPDGLLLTVERDGGDRVVARRYERDPERAPIIERAFELSENGHGDGAIARALNAEGHRTVKGRPWSRRRTQDTLLNPIYAGRVARRGRGSRKDYQRLPEPEVVPASNVAALVEPERFDRIKAQRAERDRVAPKDKDGRKRGGRRTARYALAKLAVCDRCGERMYAATSPYERKDGTHQRSYVCANVKGSTGECDQPVLDATKIDTAVVAYLGRMFVDFEAWQAELAHGREAQRDAAQTALDAALSELDRFDRLAEKVEADYLRQLDAGNEGAGEFAASALGRIKRQRRDAERRVKGRQAEVEASAPPSADALLDAYNDLARAVRGQGEGDNLGDLNERLRAEFEEFRLDGLGDVVAVLPVLRPREGLGVDVAAAFRAWDEAGQPEPTAEEVEAWERASAGPVMVGADGAVPAPNLPPRSPALVWATGRDAIRPPAKALRVELSKERPNAQE